MRNESIQSCWSKLLAMGCFLALVGMSTNAWAIVAVFSCETDEDCEEQECQECVENICVQKEDCGGEETGDVAPCECESDSDCGECGKCSDFCWCVPGGEDECESDDDCEGGTQCEWGECGNICIEVDQEGGGAPECEVDSDCGECGFCDGWMCQYFGESECEGDDDCDDGEYCVPGECGNYCEKKTGDNPWAELCGSSGGNWVECLPGCGMPTCDNPDPGVECDMACMSACECPDWMPYWDEDKGCVGQPFCDELACEVEGKVWDECGTSSCPGCDDCIGTCECPVGTQENEAGDCVSPLPIDQLCADTGGNFNECGSACAPDPCNPDEPVDCVAVCVEVCECPEDKPIWDAATGCTEGEIPEPICDGPGKFCEDTGGTWDECAGSSCPGCDDCIADCYCPEGTSWMTDKGCVELPDSQTICADTGGDWQCVSACDPGEDCEAVCYYTCVCPEDLPYFSLLDGCIEEPAEEGGETGIFDPSSTVTIEKENDDRDGCVVSSGGLHLGLLTFFLGLGGLGIGITLRRRRSQASRQ